MVSLRSGRTLGSRASKQTPDKENIDPKNLLPKMEESAREEGSNFKKREKGEEMSLDERQAKLQKLR